MIRKCASLKVSEIVFDLLGGDYDICAADKSMWLETFCNCREQGLCLKYWTENGDTITIWVFEARNSDDIVVVKSNEYSNVNMYSETAYNNRVHFNYNEYYKCYLYIKKLVLEGEVCENE